MDLARGLDGLVFNLDRSRRYHQRRRAHYERAHRLLSVMTVVSGSAGAAMIYQQRPLLGACVLVVASFAAALDRVFTPSVKAREHTVLHERFCALLAEVQRRPAATLEDYAAWIAKRVEIEAAEPPIFCALEKDCYADACRALGRPVPGDCVLSRLEWALMNYARFDRVSARPALLR